MNNEPEKRRRGRPRKMEEVEQVAGQELPLTTFQSVQDFRSVVFTDKVKMVKEGITKEQLTRLKEIFGLDYDTLSELLSVTNRALHLRKGMDKLNRNISDRLIAIVDIWSLGYDIFGDPIRFHAWLKTPSRNLGNVMPIQLLDTIVGVMEVRSELKRMDGFIL